MKLLRLSTKCGRSLLPKCVRRFKREGSFGEFFFGALLDLVSHQMLSVESFLPYLHEDLCVIVRLPVCVCEYGKIHLPRGATKKKYKSSLHLSLTHTFTHLLYPSIPCLFDMCMCLPCGILLLYGFRIEGYASIARGEGMFLLDRIYKLFLFSISPLSRRLAVGKQHDFTNVPEI